MRRLMLAAFITAIGGGLVAARPAFTQAGHLAVTLAQGPGRVDVLVDGQPFTSYLYPATLQKPVLSPIRSAGGLLVTRGYPLEPRPGERADHPHHVGHWFNHGDVNGYDFWGHSDATPAANRPKMGTIVHRAMPRATGGPARGELVVEADWTIPDGSVLLRETTAFTFAGAAGRRTIDRTTTWRAVVEVRFGDTKEGSFGIRVARGLEHPSASADVLVGADGKGTDKRVDSTGVTGQYLGSDGRTGESVWGTRGPWMGLVGKVDGSPVTLAILDHPSNHGHPTSWHARGYGLFAANPFGRQGFDPKQPAVTRVVKAGEALTFRHRILVLDGQATTDQLAREFTRYTTEAPGK